MVQIGPTNCHWLICVFIHIGAEYMTDLFIVKWMFAFSPILTVLVLMIFKNWSGSRAGAAGWFVALITATLVFGAHPVLLAYSQVKGALLSLNVLYIIWAALLLYNVVNETGAIKVIGMGIEKIQRGQIHTDYHLWMGICFFSPGCCRLWCAHSGGRTASCRSWIFPGGCRCRPGNWPFMVRHIRLDGGLVSGAHGRIRS